MTSSELYRQAFAAQFEEKNAVKAISYYEKILDMFPNSYEAPMARRQISELRSETVATNPLQQRNPVELMEKQVAILEDIRRQQLEQNAQIEQLHSSLNDLRVRIADFNMPFWSLVGIIVKASIAAIPAYFIVGIFVFIPLVFLFSSCSAFKR